MKNTLVILLVLLGQIALGQQALTLQQCRQMALEHNQKLRIAEEQIGAAQSMRKAALTQFTPNFSFNGTYTYLNKEFKLLNKDLLIPVIPFEAIDPATGGLNPASLQNPAIASKVIAFNPATGQPIMGPDGKPVFQNYAWLPESESKVDLHNLYLMNAGMVQPIYMGGKIRQAYKMARLGEKIAQEGKSIETSEVLYKTEESYCRVIALQEKVQLAQSYRTMLEQLIKDLNNLLQEGIITNNDVLRAKVKLNEVDLNLFRAENGLKLSAMALCQVIGLPLTSEVTLTDSIQIAATQEAQDQYITKALADRAELKALEHNISMADANVKMMLSRFLPNIGVTANYAIANPTPWDGMQSEFGGDWNVGVVCNIPLFHGGERHHTMNIAKHEKRIAELRKEEAMEMITLQVQQSIFNYNESQKKVEMTHLALSQADENLRVTRDNFSEGILKTTDILEAQALWQKAHSEFIDARNESRLQEINLQKVIGSLNK